MGVMASMQETMVVGMRHCHGCDCFCAGDMVVGMGVIASTQETW